MAMLQTRVGAEEAHRPEELLSSGKEFARKEQQREGAGQGEPLSGCG